MKSMAEVNLNPTVAEFETLYSELFSRRELLQFELNAFVNFFDQGHLEIPDHEFKNLKTSLEGCLTVTASISEEICQFKELDAILESLNETNDILHNCVDEMPAMEKQKRETEVEKWRENAQEDIRSFIEHIERDRMRMETHFEKAEKKLELEKSMAREDAQERMQKRQQELSDLTSENKELLDDYNSKTRALHKMVREELKPEEVVNVL